MEGQTHVLVMCCNRLLRESIARILSKRACFQIIASQSIGTVSPYEIVEWGADVVVYDSLLSVLEEGRCPLQNQSAKNPIRSILVAMDDNAENFLAAVRHGVLGYVLREASAAEVVSAIRAVAAGEAVCPTRFAKVLFDYVASQSAESNARSAGEQLRLTRRERQLIPLINCGLTNKEIGNRLNVSEQTVKSHIHRILRKVGADNRQSLSRTFPFVMHPS